MVSQGRHNLSQAVAVGGHTRRLGHEQARGRQVARDHRVEVDQEGTQRQPNDECDQRVNSERPQGQEVLVPVEAAHRLAHRFNPICEREHRMQETEKRRQHLNRVQAGRAGNLHDHDDDAQALTDVLEARRKHVDDRHVDHRNNDRRPHESRARDGLHANDQVTDRHDKRLDDAEEGEQHPPAHVLGGRGGGAYPLLVDIELEEKNEGERADPQRQVRKQGCHRRPVGGDREHRLRLDRGRRRHEGSNRFRVGPQRGRQVTQRVRRRDRRDVRGHAIQVRLDGAHVSRAVRCGSLRVVEQRIQLIEQRRHLVTLAAQSIERRTHRRGGARKIVDSRRECRNLATHARSRVRHGRLHGVGGGRRGRESRGNRRRGRGQVRVQSRQVGNRSRQRRVVVRQIRQGRTRARKIPDTRRVQITENRANRRVDRVAFDEQTIKPARRPLHGTVEAARVCRQVGQRVRRIGR